MNFYDQIDNFEKEELRAETKQYKLDRESEVGNEYAGVYVYPEQGMQASPTVWVGMIFMMMATMVCVCIGVCLVGASCGAMAYKMLMSPEPKMTDVKYDQLDAES